MPTTLTLSRAQFNEACKAYVDAHSNDNFSDVKTFSSGWVWTDHPYIANLGYLSRTVQIPRRAIWTQLEDHSDLEGLVGDEDDAVCDAAADLLTCTQCIVHSATFEVPTFYFTVHDSSGSPLSLTQILESPIFRPHSLPSANGTGASFGLALPESSFALLSQGDHPTLGTPSWYFHPCHTAEIVGEIMAEFDDQRGGPLRWMEAWFMIMSNIVDFFEGRSC